MVVNGVATMMTDNSPTMVVVDGPTMVERQLVVFCEAEGFGCS